MNTTHTPGPWTYQDRSDDGMDGNIWSPNNQDIAQVYCTDMERGLADAALIAAAPELLEALCWARQEILRANKRFNDVTEAKEYFRWMNKIYELTTKAEWSAE